MKDRINRYKRQYKNAISTYEKLKTTKNEIEFKLESNPVCTNLHKDLREINLDITITLNEIEHIESCIFDSGPLSN